MLPGMLIWYIGYTSHCKLLTFGTVANEAPSIGTPEVFTSMDASRYGLEMFHIRQKIRGPDFQMLSAFFLGGGAHASTCGVSEWRLLSLRWVLCRRICTSSIPGAFPFPEEIWPRRSPKGRTEKLWQKVYMPLLCRATYHLRDNHNIDRGGQVLTYVAMYWLCRVF